MTTFQQIALILTVIWLLLVLVRFRHSRLVLIGELVTIGLYTLVALLVGKVTLAELGLGIPNAWVPTLLLSLAWLGLMISYSPLADWLASRWFSRPPTLESFRAIQQSTVNLIAGILAAWVLGGILEELIARGIVLLSVQAWLATWFPAHIATTIAVCVSALGAGLMHSYQGPRAMAIIT